MPSLVLSIFPGIDLLGRAFESEGFCVVRGPDPIFGGDIHDFHPPAGVWGGVIGGPPCQIFSALRRLNPHAGERYGNLIPEFERVVSEARPLWFLMENVPDATDPIVSGYEVTSLVLNNRWLGEVQARVRKFWFGTSWGARLLPEVVIFESIEYAQAVTSSSRLVPVKIGGSGKTKRTYTTDGKRHGPSIGPRMTLGTMLELQGAPADLLDDCPWTESGKRKAVGNGVPLPMGRAIARAVKRAMEAASA